MRIRAIFSLASCLAAAAFIAGCATAIDVSRAAPTLSAIEQGTLLLDCELSCAFDYGYRRSTLKEQYTLNNHTMVGLIVGTTGHKINQSYYYLGWVAQQRGYPDAAMRYYIQALAATRCDFLINNCDGLDVPLMATLGLRAVERMKAERSQGQAQTAAAPPPPEERKRTTAEARPPVESKRTTVVIQPPGLAESSAGVIIDARPQSTTAEADEREAKDRLTSAPPPVLPALTLIDPFWKPNAGNEIVFVAAGPATIIGRVAGEASKFVIDDRPVQLKSGGFFQAPVNVAHNQIIHFTIYYGDGRDVTYDLKVKVK